MAYLVGVSEGLITYLMKYARLAKPSVKEAKDPHTWEKVDLEKMNAFQHHT